MNTEEIKHGGKALALIIYGQQIEEGVSFFTANESPLQVGQHAHKKGKTILAHRHCPVKIERVGSMYEVLFIQEGKVRVTFYEDEGGKIDSRIIQAGDMILLMEGGHGFEFLEDTKMIEIKQGPYRSESRKNIQAKEMS